MSNLKDLYISDSYTGLLHTASTLLTGNKVQVFDGAGNESALHVGSKDSGISVSGQLSAGGFTYPIADIENGLLVSDGNLSITMKSLQDLLILLGSNISDGVYANPTITFTDGVITDVTGTIPSIVTSEDDAEVVVTKYNTGITYASSVLINPTDWTAVTLPTYVPSTAKAIIGYLIWTGGADQKSFDIKCSRDGGETYVPVFYVKGGEDATGGKDPIGLGVQFNMYTNGASQITFKDFGDSGQTNSFDFHVIAYQY